MGAQPAETVFHVRLTPRAATDRLDGAERDAEGRWRLRARVRAVPEKGAANAALLRLLTDALGLAPSKVRLEAGAASREKRVRVLADPASVGDALRALAPGGIGDAASG